MSDSTIPRGYCRCGCGGRTKIATKTDRRQGWVKGKPQHYLRSHNGRYANARVYKSCVADGCDQNPRSGHAAYCGKHYHRLYRHGTLETKKPEGRIRHSNGYELVYVEEHPIFIPGRCYEHRIVFFANNGNGPFNCYRCGKRVGWDDNRGFHIHHVNENKSDNSPSNLVPSCIKCNTARGVGKAVDTKRERYGFEFRGVKKNISEWAKATGIGRTALHYRLRKKWPLEKVFTEPLSGTGPKPK